MTIETATPSSVEAIAALFDTLVELVSTRVMAQVESMLEDKVDALNLDELIETGIRDSGYLDDRILERVQEMEFDVQVSVTR